MNKKIIIGILIILLITSFFLYPKIKEARIKSELIKANYCDAASDCVNAGSKCPFGCYNYVNKNEVDRISKLINSYDSKCVYGCLTCLSAVCEDHKCKEVCE
jgi:hypothetical protein